MRGRIAHVHCNIYAAGWLGCILAIHTLRHMGPAEAHHCPDRLDEVVSEDTLRSPLTIRTCGL